jgi:hypothetical protein
MESDVTDLPEPDSPTIATISPLLTCRDIFFIAEIFSNSVEKSTERFLICRRGCKYEYVIYCLLFFGNIFML